MSPLRLTWLAVAALACALAVAPAAGALPVPVPGQTPSGDLNRPPARASEAVVLHGADLADWSARSNQTVKVPFTDVFDCPKVSGRDDCEHNHYTPPDLDTGGLGKGADVGRMAGFRWDARRARFVQIPFQVDEVFVRYLDNDASGFAAYSGQDQHTTYAYDREGWRYTANAKDDACRAVPPDGVRTTADPVPGLDDNDEMAFMAADAGPRAPAGSDAPAGAERIKEVAVRDPADPAAAPTYVYLAEGVRPRFDGSNGYVRYRRDRPRSGWFEKSESSYSDYGNAAKGPHCDAEGNVVLDADGKPDVQRRRPRDWATVKTDRYRFRYDGRWLMTALNISSDGGSSFGPDVIDRWKARAFAQDPSSETPCCGFEEEDTHWGGSSTLLGELRGPVRAIRETWGADSGTNVIRRETFYRESLVQKSWLRVHPIPPLDGIYAQWDFNGGAVTRFFNSRNAELGVPVDGRNDEAFGNLDDPCNENYSLNDTSPLDQGYRNVYAQSPLCDLSPYHQSVDFFDPTFSQANTALEWSQVSGPGGTVVDRYHVQPDDVTAGGLAQSALAVPYYRDDSCFDDGTGDDPGPRLKPGSADEPREGRTCWHPEDGATGDPRFFQGSIATHGVHLLFIADSDNARQTVPIDEIVSEQDMVMLPGEQPGSVGESYGEAFEQPLTAEAQRAVTVRDASAPSVVLRARRTRRGRVAKLRWSGRDTGGSGLRSYTLQVRAPHRRWRTLRRATTRRAARYRARRGGRHAFRVRAVDGAGNRGAWALRRARLLSP
jgi:hypothetical protein